MQYQAIRRVGMILKTLQLTVGSYNRKDIIIHMTAFIEVNLTWFNGKDRDIMP